MISETKLRGEYFEQLGLNLEIEEVEVSSGISPDEAQRISNLAQQALAMRFGEVIKKGESEYPLITWREDYEEIARHGWPWRVAAYIAWASSPRKYRWPKSQDELAREVLGLTSDRVISTWRKKNEAIDEMISLLQSAPLLKHRRDIYEALAESASRADHRSNPDRKLALEVLGDYIPHAKIDLRRDKVDDLSDLSEEELAKIAGRSD
jgi:hypothetical protein